MAPSCSFAPFLPSCLPTFLPSCLPTSPPSCLPAFLPSCLPTFLPSYLPTSPPSYLPTFPLPTFLPSYLPTFPPSYLPTFLHSYLPAFLPFYLPAFLPSYLPASLPFPTFLSSCIPTFLPPYLFLHSYLTKGAPDRIVGLLDVFGFESLQENGLEQICINLANETLHNLFLSHVFHGISASQLRTILGDDAARIDNAKCLELLATPPNGILQLLDFQCKAPRASDETFCLAVNQKHGGGASSFLKTPTLSRTCTSDEKTAFIVRHYAGDVLYSAGRFLELNNDSMHDSRWLKQGVGNALVRKLFSDPTLQPAAPVKKGFVSVGAKFCRDLAELIATLKATEISYVRCMKPNLQMQPRLFEPSTVRERVRAAGTVSVLKYTRKLMPSSLSLSTLGRLRQSPHLSRLPPSARGETDLAGFALALLTALGVPASQVRVLSS